MVHLITVSDAHLLDKNMANYSNFIDFLKYWINNPPKNFVLLGDIFDFYCNSNKRAFFQYKEIIKLLETLSQKTNLIFIEGNHEFSISLDNLKIIKENTIIKINNKKVYFAHGDIETTYKLSYLFLRKFLHSNKAELLCKLIPDNLIWNIATTISGYSKKHQIFDDYFKINKRMIKFVKVIKPKADIAIFGHSHYNFIHSSTRPLIINSGSWIENKFIIWENNTIEVRNWKNLKK